MTSKLSILLIDKYPYIVYALKNIFNSIEFASYAIQFHVAHNSEEAGCKIKDHSFNIAILGLDLKICTEQNLYCDEDLGLLIRKLQPNCKIVILTGDQQPYRLDQIAKNIHPEGFLSKMDLNMEKSIFIYKNIIAGQSQISSTVIQSLYEFRKKNIQLDEYDKLILLRISEGIKTTDLKNYIPLSRSAIEKRKQRLKINFGMDKAKDKDLIDEALRLGIL